MNAENSKRPGGVSVVTDMQPGRATRHGLSKLIAAFESKGLGCDTITSLDEATAGIVIVAGLSGGPRCRPTASTGLSI